MVQPGRELGAQPDMLRAEFFRDLLEGLQMRSGIAIPKRVIGDESETALEKGAQRVEGRHTDYMCLLRK